MAAGQIFFTLSIGTGTIQCYASYLGQNEDCALTGLTTAATNEFAEVELGATIAIPIAVATFGLASTQVIAAQGSFDLGFVAMPIIFEQLPAGRLFGTLWFALLFFAGLTSSVAMCSPLVALLHDEFNMPRSRAAIVCGGGPMWSELRRNADLAIPREFYYVIRFVVPLYFVALLVGWRGKFFVLILLGFAGTDFVIAKTLSAP